MGVPYNPSEVRYMPLYTVAALTCGIVMSGNDFVAYIHVSRTTLDVHQIFLLDRAEKVDKIQSVDFPDNIPWEFHVCKDLKLLMRQSSWPTTDGSETSTYGKDK
ncbi:hypothetical protein Tco_0126467 [Tanacetum coccineum]